MEKLILGMLALTFLAGCVSTKNVRIDQNSASRMSGKNIVSTLGEDPNFAATTAGKAMFGGLGTVAVISEGNRIIKDNNVDDPAHYIGEQLLKDLSSRYSLNISSIGNVESTDDVKKLTVLYDKTDFILDVRTINWSFLYFPTDWDSYRVIYSVKLRLIDVELKKLIAEGFCSNIPEQTEQSPSHEELLSNSAARLKKELRIAANKCIGEFKDNILSK